MKNKYRATCWVCGLPVNPLEGYVGIALGGKSRVKHFGCTKPHAFAQSSDKDTSYAEDYLDHLHDQW